MPASRPLKDRFEEKYRIDPETGCWNWTSTTLPDGYGLIRNGERQDRAHRVSYELFVGPIPEGLFVCHTCDNPSCVNPVHLFVGTHRENTDDMIRKGRNGKKLSKDQVHQIRSMKGQMSQKKIAERFNVSQTTVWEIFNSRTWSKS